VAVELGIEFHSLKIFLKNWKDVEFLYFAKNADFGSFPVLNVSFGVSSRLLPSGVVFLWAGTYVLVGKVIHLAPSVCARLHAEFFNRCILSIRVQRSSVISGEDSTKSRWKRSAMRGPKAFAKLLPRFHFRLRPTISREFREPVFLDGKSKVLDFSGDFRGVPPKGKAGISFSNPAIPTNYMRPGFSQEKPGLLV
jgi:hypothetical protein